MAYEDELAPGPVLGYVVKDYCGNQVTGLFKTVQEAGVACRELDKERTSHFHAIVEVYDVYDIHLDCTV